jgi:hypothetical protein
MGGGRTVAYKLKQAQERMYDYLQTGCVRKQGL